MELKNTKLVKGLKKAGKVGAAIGGSAVIGCLLKKADYKDIKGFSKLLVPLGIFGLAHAGGRLASSAVESEIDSTADVIDSVVDTDKLKDLFSEEEDSEIVEPVVEV